MDLREMQKMWPSIFTTIGSQRANSDWFTREGKW